jgi:NADH dehydrogenase FAD-containing subunit
MSDQRNIVILGGSSSGLSAAHYILRHTLPALKAKHSAKYHVYLVNPTKEWYFRIASPRIAASTSLLPVEKALFDIEAAFKQYSSNDFTFVQATATGLNPTTRTVTYKKNQYLEEEELSYHALVVATGTRTHDPTFSMHTDTPALLDAIKTRNTEIKAAKSIIIVGGGPTGVEHAGEVGELLNGKPGWFSTPPPKTNITLITADPKLLPVLRPAIAKIAENKLKKLGVDVIYNTRVANVTTKDNKTTVTLAKGEKLEADLYIPAHGVLPNTSYIPDELLNDKGYLKTNASTLRVDEAGPRVYALGDVASYSRNFVLDIYDAAPVLAINLERDLLSFDPKNPTAKPKGSDRVYTPNTKEMQFVPIGTGGGVGAILGWKAPSWFVWLLKGRDFMVGLATGPLVTGDKFKKAYTWKPEEAVV